MAHSDEKKKTSYDIIIAGAGAAGLFLACLLSAKGRSVLILEKNKVPGKKLLATGNGRCNFTNMNLSEGCYQSTEPAFIQSVLKRFNASDCRAVFSEMGILSREKDGYVYPFSNQASTVVDCMVRECEKNHVTFHMEETVKEITHEEQFCIRTTKGIYFSTIFVLATGGKANAPLGGDGSGYKLCRSQGHHITELSPGLTGFYTDKSLCQPMAGVRVQGRLSLWINEKKVAEDTGEIQITKDRISGIPAFQLCRMAGRALASGATVSCAIDFMPQMSKKECAEYIHKHGIWGMINKKCISLIEKCARENKDTDMQMSEKLAAAMKHFVFPIYDTAGFESAQVTVGGVRTDEVDESNMESKYQKGLFLLGELLDVDGICGGYNLHFAWAGAWIAAQYINQIFA